MKGGGGLWRRCLRLELLVAGSSQNARQLRVRRSYQISAMIAAGVSVAGNMEASV